MSASSLVESLGPYSDLVPWPIDERDVCRRDPAGRLFEFPIYTEQQPLWGS